MEYDIDSYFGGVYYTEEEDTENWNPFPDNDKYDPWDDYDGGDGLEEQQFEERRHFRKGKHTHRIREDLDNLNMLQLRMEGYTYRKIAALAGCSPGTVRNRLNRLKEI